jgi:hypothetical protein
LQSGRILSASPSLFAEGLQLAGIKLTDRGINPHRFGLLYEYLTIGMQAELPVQPQGYERGVRFETNIVALFLEILKHSTLSFPNSTLGSFPGTS